jgi:hypothetical protein
MTLLRFTLSEEGVNALRDALTCLNKFSDEVSLEAKKDRVRCYKSIELSLGRNILDSSSSSPL